MIDQLIKIHQFSFLLKIVDFGFGLVFAKKPNTPAGSGIAVEEASKSTNPTVNLQKPKEADEKNVSSCPASAQYPLISYKIYTKKEKQWTSYKNIPLTREVREALKFQNNIYGVKINFGKLSLDSAAALISQSEPDEFGQVTQAFYRGLRKVAPLEVIKALITACESPAPSVVEEIHTFIIYGWLDQTDLSLHGRTVPPG